MRPFRYGTQVRRCPVEESSSARFVDGKVAHPMRVSRSGFLASLAALGVLSEAAPSAAALPPWYPLPPPLKPKIPTRALVLSGAGARGAYEAGVLKWLFKDIDTNGPPYHLICGTSAGSINTAFAARATSASIAQVGKLWLDMPQA